MHTTKLLTVTTVGLAAALATGCIPDNNGDANSVDHESTKQALEDNSVRLEQSFSKSTEFIEGSPLIHGGAEAYESDTSCSSSGSDTTCETEETGDYEMDTSEPRANMVDALERAVFDEDHIVSQSRAAITYQLPGEEMCPKTATTCTGGSDGETTCESTETTESGYDEQCLERAEKMDYRIRVTRPGSDFYKFETLVGSDNYRPVVFELSPDHVAAEANLGEIRKSVEYYDEVYETESASNFPSTFSGTVRAKFERKGEQKVHFETRIKAPVEVGGDDYSLSLASATKPVFGWTADGSDEKVTTTVDFNAIDASFPYTYYESTETQSHDSDGSGTETNTKTLQHDLHFAGLSTKAIYRGASEALEFERVGLGDSTSWLEIAGKRVLSVDLNRNAGRQFSATVSPVRDGEGLKFDIEPKFNFRTMLQFKRISDKLESLPMWSYDDTIEADFSGATPVSFIADSGALEVVSGALTLSSENPQITHRAGAGECLVSADPGTTSEDGAEPHPLEYYETRTCSK